MIWLIVVIIVLIVLGSVFTAKWYKKEKNNIWDRGDEGFFAVIAFVAAALCLSVIIVNAAGKSHSRTNCKIYGTAIEQEVKFETYGSFQWDCLVKTNEGWIPIDQVYKIEE